MVIPKPLCQCRICREARRKGVPYARAGPSAFLHDINLLIDTPGIFEEGLKHGFKYPPGYISRTTLYTFERIMELATHLQAKKVVFVHLEEYWNRSYDDYHALEADYPKIRFAYDGMQLRV